MVFPLTALFFGTGNQTPRVSAAVVARVFLDPQLRLFEYSPKRLLDDVPRMFAFPKLREVFFSTIASGIQAPGVSQMLKYQQSERRVPAGRRESGVSGGITLKFIKNRQKLAE